MADTKTETSGAGAKATEVSLLDDILAETKMTPSDEGYDVAKRGVQAFIAELRRPGAREREGRQGLRRRAHRRDRRPDDLAPDQRDPPPPRLPEARVRVARPQVRRRPDGLPREHPGRAAQLLARRSSSPTSRTRPRCPRAASTRSSTRPSTAVRRQALRRPSSPTTSSAPARRTSRSSRSARPSPTMAHAPFIAAAGPQFFGAEKTSSTCPTSRTSSPSSRARSTPSTVASARREDARYVGLVLPRFLLRLPYGDEHGPGEDLQLRRGRGRQARRVPAGATPLRLRHPHRRQLRQVPLVPEHHRPPGRRHGGEPPAPPVRGDGRSSRPRSPPRSCSRSAASSSSRRRASSASPSARTRDNACFFSANSVQKPKYFGQSEEGRAAEMNYRLGTAAPVHVHHDAASRTT